MSVNPSVHTFLGRPGPARGNRTLKDHLNPSRQVQHSSAAQLNRSPVGRAPRISMTHPNRTGAAEPPRVMVAEVGKARASEVRHVLDEDSPTREVKLSDLSGVLRVALVWKPQVNAAGVTLSSPLGIGGLWQTRARDEGALQSLGGRVAAPGYGARQVARMSGRAEDHEEVLVDTKHLTVMRRLFFYAYSTREGALDWGAHELGVRIQERSGTLTTLTLPGAPQHAKALMALSVHVLEDRLVLRREDEHGASTRDLAQAYGFDLGWDSAGMTPR